MKLIKRFIFLRNNIFFQMIQMSSVVLLNIYLNHSLFLLNLIVDSINLIIQIK